MGLEQRRHPGAPEPPEQPGPHALHPPQYSASWTALQLSNNDDILGLQSLLNNQGLTASVLHDTQPLGQPCNYQTMTTSCGCRAS